MFIAAGTHWAAIVACIGSVATAIVAIVAMLGIRTSHRAIEENRRARVDARSPIVVVDVDAGPQWPPLADSVIGGQPQPLEGEAAHFTVPAQDAQTMFVRFPLRFSNH